MTARIGERFGQLVVVGRSGRKTEFRCDCGASEAYRLSSKAIGGAPPYDRCANCAAKPCLTCGQLVLRGRSPYCSRSCQAAAMGKRQAAYYRQRMLDPVQRAKRTEEVRCRRKGMSEEQRERRRAQGRARRSTLKPEEKAEGYARQREWYLREFDRISAARKEARRRRNPEQRAKDAQYQHCYHVQKLADLRSSPERLREYRRRQRLALLRWRNTQNIDQFVLEICCLEKLISEQDS